eukprot:TRINITY_DN1838_c0_g2_i1.p1 TRINITY_DN1838_c0_g2~~TRINITY_DN1838_c0_g2_i1.p1  ORF type:complete len:57 (+),score=2.88 TRINITY_DN1838_c0_g2_i1:22-192(+)
MYLLLIKNYGIMYSKIDLIYKYKRKKGQKPILHQASTFFYRFNIEYYYFINENDIL